MPVVHWSPLLCVVLKQFLINQSRSAGTASAMSFGVAGPYFLPSVSGALPVIVYATCSCIWLLAICRNVYREALIRADLIISEAYYSTAYPLP